MMSAIASALVDTALDLLDQSPGHPEYVRGMANLIANATGRDGDEILDTLTTFNEQAKEDQQHYLIERPGGSTPTETEPIDVWLRTIGGEAEAEANTYLTETGYRVDWYLTAVGLIKSVEFDTLADAYNWLEREGFVNYSTEVNQ